MGAVLRSIILGISLCLIACVPNIYLYFLRFGVGLHVFNHSPGPCRVIPGLEYGSEDIAVTQDGLAFISNGLRGDSPFPHSMLIGNIFLFDFNNPDNNVTRLSVISETMNLSDFEPHGLSIWESNNSELLLFAVDHGNKSNTVKIFSFDRKKRDMLFHKETIRDTSFGCLNDLVAVGSRQFFATNFVYRCATVMLEHIFFLPWGSVTYYDGSKGSIVADALTGPNGINTSPDGEYLFVASLFLNDLLVYERRKGGDIKLHKTIKINSAVDNIHVDQDSGELYIGSHRRVDRFMFTLADYNGSRPAPSQILRIRQIGKDWNNVEVTEILSNDGQNFVRASSVGAFYKGQLLVGSVYHRLGYCKVINKQDSMML